MKTTILLLAILAISCQTEPIGQSLSPGYLSYHGNIMDFSISKSAVPQCSDFTPNEICIALVKPINGSSYTLKSPITISGNQVTANDQMVLPEGDYLVQEVSLKYNGIVTHSAPQTLDPRYDFGIYADHTLPYSLTIVADQTIDVQDQVMCYSEEIITLDQKIQWGAEIVQLQTMYFYVPENFCIDNVSIEINLGAVNIIPITQAGLYAIPIPKQQYTYKLRAFVNGTNPQTLSGTTYNPDGNLNQNDVLFFEPNCP